MDTMKPSDVIHRFVENFKNGTGSMAPLDELLDRNLVHHLDGFKAIAG